MTAPDMDTVLDSDYEKTARLSLATQSHSRKRDGAEMSGAGVAPCAPTKEEVQEVEGRWTL